MTPVPTSGLDPDYALAFIPPRACARAWARLTLPGWWELLTIADYDAGGCASDDWTLPAPRRTPAADLAAWAASLLGCPVTLEADTTRVKVGGRFTRWHEEPVYWVRLLVCPKPEPAVSARLLDRDGQP